MKLDVHFRTVCRVLFTVVVAWVPLAASALPPAVTHSANSKTAPVAVDYGKLPLGFEANQGQSDKSVRFLSRGNGYALYLTDSGAVMALGGAGNCKGTATSTERNSGGKTGSEAASCADVNRNKLDVVRMRLAGASGSNKGSFTQVTGEDELPGKVNYFIGNDPAKWRSNLPTYARVHYSRVYPGIDLIYYGNQGHLEYDFVVSPGADPEAIRLNFAGQKDLRIAANGDLVIEGENALATLHQPVVYQMKNGHRESVSAGFDLVAKDDIRFRLGSYDHSRLLVIDPVLVYSTYLGGGGLWENGDGANGIAVNAAGNAYVVGTAYSVDFPITNHAFERTRIPNGYPKNVVFISKLNTSGSGLVYSTYLGGTGGDFGYGIALDSVDNAYIAGATYSTDFPVTCGAIQTANPSKTAGATTGFVAKLSADGSALDYSSYLGGSGNMSSQAHGDVAQAVAMGQNGYAYVTGYTYSADFPVTSGAFQPNKNGGTNNSNAFVAKINPIGTALAYATYVGGDSIDYGNGIAVDTSGNAFVAGGTNSTNFPTTSGSYQTTLHGYPSAFVTELNPTGTEEVYSSLLGGSGGDSAQGVALDSSGFVYVAGNTHSTDFPTTDGALQGTAFGTSQYFQYSNPAGFVTKISKEGSALVYSTYLESPGTTVTGLAVDGTGSAYVTGYTGTQGVGYFGGFQPTPDALATPTTAQAVVFLVKLDPTAAVLNYATLLGGYAGDWGTSVAVNSAGNAYVAGFATSPNFPVTSKAFQQKKKKYFGQQLSNAFISEFALAGETNQTTYPAPPSGVPTSMSIVSDIFQWGICDLVFVEYITVDINTPIPGPPPTGIITVQNDGGGYASYFDVYGSWGGVSQISMVNDPGEAFPQWTAYYSGDSIYQGSSVSGDPGAPGCDPSQIANRKKMATNPGITSRIGTAGNPSKGELKVVVNPSSGGVAQVASSRVKVSVQGPKYTPPVPLNTSVTQRSATPDVHPYVQGGQPPPSCFAPAPLPKLTVSVQSKFLVYGDANPPLTYTVSGLVNGDTVNVNLSTTVTPASPAGDYPIKAIVSGPALASYTLVLNPGTLEVRKRLLSIIASNETVTYGQTPSHPSGFSFYGFINGDDAGVVSGAPTLATNVTSTTPTGYYSDVIGLGTLTAANYYFAPFAHPGIVHVVKAPLTVKPDSVTMHAGGPVPPLTYSFAGFVNTDTAASSVTGAPLLNTFVTTATKPGTYPIFISNGTLASNNYHITAVVGQIVVEP